MVSESSISRLPNEVLERIFIENCNLYRLDCESRRFGWTKSPRQLYRDKGTIVAQICRRWRSISLNYGELWSYICILDYSLHQINEYLLRSKNSPLEVVYTGIPSCDLLIDVSGDPGSEETRAQKRLFEFERKIEALEDHIWRIEYLRLYRAFFSNNFEFSQGWVARCLKEATRLQYLSICSCSVDSYSVAPVDSEVSQDINIPYQPSTLSELVLAGFLPTITTSLRLDTISRLTLARMKVNINTLCDILGSFSAHLNILKLLDINLKGRINRDRFTTVKFTQLTEFHAYMDFLDHTSLLRFIDYSVETNVFSIIRFSIANIGMLKCYLEKHFKTLHVAGDEIKMTVNPKGDFVQLRIGKFLEKIVCEPIGGSIWPLCNEVYGMLHHAFPIHSLKSFELRLLHTESEKYSRVILGDNDSSHMVALKHVLQDSETLQRVYIGIPSENEGYPAGFEFALMEILGSYLQGLERKEDGSALQSITLKGLTFSDPRSLSACRVLASKLSNVCLILVP